MKTHLSLMPLLVLALALSSLACPESAWAKDKKTSYCESDEYPIFYGEADGAIVAICLPDDPAAMGNYLTLYMKHPNGNVIDLRGEIFSDSRFVVARSIDLSEGGYSYLRIKQGKREYIVYSGVGRFSSDSDEPKSVAGFAVEESGALVEHFDMTETFTSELGQELFDMLEFALDAYDFNLPNTEATEEMRLLGDALADRIFEIKANGHRAFIRTEGAGILSEKPCRFYSLGEYTKDKYSAIEHYAVDRSGRIYVMNADVDGKYVPLSSVAPRKASPPQASAANWEGEYASENGSLKIEKLRESSAHGHTFQFSFIIDGKTAGQGSAAADEKMASSFELDFTLENGGKTIRVTHVSEVEISPEEEWSKQCAGVYTRQ